MLGLIFVALLQATEPAPAEAQAQPGPAPAATEQTEETTQNADAERRRTRRCTSREITGTRLQSVQRCRTENGHQDEDTRRVMETIQHGGPLSGT
ncbi:MAG: hypothetical protein ACT4OF_15500 [Caulobacteraceae bacterium]